MEGYIHSIETMGTLDGPGVRTVVFLQGCPNRCKFCHNPDTILKKGGTLYKAEELVEEVLKSKEYWRDYSTSDPEKKKIKGGVTFSGGEPLFQFEFLSSVIKKLKDESVHVVIDTSANATFEEMNTLMPNVDLWMISVKQMFNAVHRELIGVSNKNILENILKLDDVISKYNETHGTKKKIRIRFVIIPGLTDTEAHLNALGEFVAKINNLETMELLPYSTIGRDKWIELFGKYELEGIREANMNDIEKVKSILSNYISSFLYVK